MVQPPFPVGRGTGWRLLRRGDGGAKNEWRILLPLPGGSSGAPGGAGGFFMVVLPQFGERSAPRRGLRIGSGEGSGGCGPGRGHRSVRVRQPDFQHGEARRTSRRRVDGVWTPAEPPRPSSLLLSAASLLLRALHADSQSRPRPFCFSPDTTPCPGSGAPSPDHRKRPDREPLRPIQPLAQPRTFPCASTLSDLSRRFPP